MLICRIDMCASMSRRMIGFTFSVSFAPQFSFPIAYIPTCPALPGPLFTACCTKRTKTILNLVLGALGGSILLTLSI